MTDDERAAILEKREIAAKAYAEGAYAEGVLHRQPRTWPQAERLGLEWAAEEFPLPRPPREVVINGARYRVNPKGPESVQVYGDNRWDFYTSRGWAMKQRDFFAALLALLDDPWEPDDA